MANLEMVPFGRYKDKPVEALIQDEQYCEWLITQDWFREKYTGIHTLVVNQFGTPAETPEHNALQARFLDQNWVKAFVVAAIGGLAVAERRFESLMRDRIKELRKDLAELRGTPGYLDEFVREYCPDLKDYWKRPDEAVARCQHAILSEIENAEEARWETSMRVDGFSFESGGVDVSFRASEWLYNAREVAIWRVECKPSLGDDYPAVLRQMARSQANVLLIGEGGYCGRGATFEQVKQIFALSKICLVCISEVSAVLSAAAREAAEEAEAAAQLAEERLERLELARSLELDEEAAETGNDD